MSLSRCESAPLSARYFLTLFNLLTQRPYVLPLLLLFMVSPPHTLFSPSSSLSSLSLPELEPNHSISATQRELSLSPRRASYCHRESISVCSIRQSLPVLTVPEHQLCDCSCVPSVLDTPLPLQESAAPLGGQDGCAPRSARRAARGTDRVLRGGAVSVGAGLRVARTRRTLHPTLSRARGRRGSSTTLFFEDLTGGPRDSCLRFV